MQSALDYHELPHNLKNHCTRLQIKLNSTLQKTIFITYLT